MHSELIFLSLVKHLESRPVRCESALAALALRVVAYACFGNITLEYGLISFEGHITEISVLNPSTLNN